MIKFFYNLYFQYLTDEKDSPATHTFDIGYFSTKKQAVDIIESYKLLPGFDKYPFECFKIMKVGVDFLDNNIDKSNTILFEVYFSFEEDDYEVWEVCGVFSTREKAMDEVNKLKERKPYNSHLDAFDIRDWKVDKDLWWGEGFSSYDED